MLESRKDLKVPKWPNWIVNIIYKGGDWWADEIKSKTIPSVRFSIEQSVYNSAYIHSLNSFFFERGYCSSVVQN